MVRLRNPFPTLPTIQGPVQVEFAILALLLVATFMACFKPLADPDTYWHLAVGRQMWQTHALVRTETFSFTNPGAPWADFEWLFHALAYPLWLATGEIGLRVFTALCGVLGIGLAYRLVRLVGGGATSLALFLLPMIGAYADRVRFRPDVLSLVFFALLLEILFHWRKRGFTPGCERWLLPLLFLVWVQVHGAWAYGGLLMAALLTGALFDAKRSGLQPSMVVRSTVLPATACFAALLLNPFGWELVALPLRVLASFSDRGFVPIAEWAHTPFSGAYAWFILAAVAVFTCVLFVRQHSSWTELSLAAVQLALGLYWVRYAAFAVLAFAPLAASRLSLLRVRSEYRRIWAIGGALCAVGLALIQVPNMLSPTNLEERFPVTECSFLRKSVDGGNVLHEFRVGGYLEWALPSKFRVYMDGRFPLFRNAAMDYYQAHRTPQAFLAFLGKYPIDAAIYAYQDFQLAPSTGGPARGPSAVLFPKVEWALVSLGPYGMVLLKRGASNAETIKTYEYPVLRPDDLPYLLWAAGKGEVSRSALRADLERALREELPAGLAQSLRTAENQSEGDRP